jgi:hypothetical protein
VLYLHVNNNLIFGVPPENSCSGRSEGVAGSSVSDNPSTPVNF